MANTKVAARMHVCRECLDLRGPFLGTFDKTERIQRCACEPQEPLWNTFDYNTAAEICRCCAGVVVASGSRWSVFFCTECKERVATLNSAVGATVIPIGRHSIMNGFSVATDDLQDSRTREHFESRLVEMGNGIDRLWEHHRAHVRRVVSSIPGAEHAIPLDEYLEQARRMYASPQAAFDELLRAMKQPDERSM